MTTPIIIDCDPGHDDAIALLMAIASPKIDLLAVTAVAGNAPVADTARNARAVLTAAGVTDIPVAAGMDRPLMRRLVTAPHVHGDNGLGGTNPPAPAFDLDPRHAVDLLIDTITGSDEPVTLVPTGPLTNIATMIRMAPEVCRRIPRMILMGGSAGLGNVTPSAEFNIYVDPDAAEIVFSSGIPITMVGLDVTHRATFTAEDTARVRALNSDIGNFVADMLAFYGKADRVVGGIPLHDPCCVAAIIEPDLITTQPMNVQVETKSELTIGRTVCDVLGVTGQPPTAEVGVDIDRERFVAIVMDCLERLSRPAAVMREGSH